MGSPSEAKLFEVFCNLLYSFALLDVCSPLISWTVKLLNISRRFHLVKFLWCCFEHAFFLLGLCRFWKHIWWRNILVSTSDNSWLVITAALQINNLQWLVNFFRSHHRGSGLFEFRCLGQTVRIDISCVSLLVVFYRWCVQHALVSGVIAILGRLVSKIRIESPARKLLLRA